MFGPLEGSYNAMESGVVAGMDPNFQPTPRNVCVPTAISAALKSPLIPPMESPDMRDEVRLLSSAWGQYMPFF